MTTRRELTPARREWLRTYERERARRRRGPLTYDEWLAMDEPPATSWDQKQDECDPWLVVCERCPLLDCILPEGAQLPNINGHTNKKRFDPCPVRKAHKLGLTPAQATNGKAATLGLLEVW